MDRITLYEKYILIEKTEPEVNGVWKGAHLLLFFLAFVFGSFCTFCFHMLMYLFDEKCVLFPKMVSLTSLRQNIIYEFVPDDKDLADMLPVDFLNTHWVDKSACLLPTYVPLVSGIFGLVWTTMFLMWSIGSRVLTGLQRPWRVLPPVFIFSIVMGGLCVYTSTVTHYGLRELCLRLSEITGSTSCSYTVNVATLAYQRRIRGVYQAIQLTILTAWLHTICWLLSAFLALARVILVVDFKLVRVSVELQGNIDRMLERHERQIRTVSPAWLESGPISLRQSRSLIRIHFMKRQLRPHLINTHENLLFLTDLAREESEPSLVPVERLKLDKLAAYHKVPKEYQFIVKILYNILDTIDESGDVISSADSMESGSKLAIIRQYGQQKISSTISLKSVDQLTSKDFLVIASEINRQLQRKLDREDGEIRRNKLEFKSSINITFLQEKNTDTEEGLRSSSDESQPSTSNRVKKKIKSSLKHTGVQTEDKLKEKSLRVEFEAVSSMDMSDQVAKENKETQTKKEKQD